MASESLAEIAGLAVAHTPGGFSHAAAGLQVAQGQRHAGAGVKILRTASPGLARAADRNAFVRSGRDFNLVACEHCALITHLNFTISKIGLHHV